MAEEKLIIQKITNPRYLVTIAPDVKSYLEKIKPIGVEYESLIAYFFNSVQYGVQMRTEFWVVYDDGKAIAFAHWGVKPGPLFVGTVLCDYIYSHNRKREPLELLTKEFIDFGKSNRCTLYEFSTYGKSTYQVIENVFADEKMTITPLPQKTFAARKE